MAKTKNDDSAFRCKDCGREETADYAGEAAYPRACRVCGGPNFVAVNGHEPDGTNVAVGRLVTAEADDELTTSIQ